MTKTSTNILLIAAIAATSILSTAAPVSATPVWLPGKQRGAPDLDVQTPEVAQAERELRELRRLERIQARRDRQADGRSSLFDPSSSSRVEWEK